MSRDTRVLTDRLVNWAVVVAGTAMMILAMESVSSVRVPAVSAAVDAMRMSEALVVANDVRSLPLLPVRVAAVPPESDAVNARAGNTSRRPTPAVKAVPAFTTSMLISLMTAKPEPP